MFELKNINFKYSLSTNGNEFSLSNVDLSIAKGEFISIIGPNGSGKSTLLKIIAGLLKPVSGDINFNNKPLSSYKPKQLAKIIGYVPQNTSSVYPFSVYEIVMMGRTPHLNFSGYEKETDREIVNEALEYVGIYNLRSKGINEVSGGEAQRAFIARAFVQQPEIILLDEPNAHLDIKHQISIFDLLKSFNNDKELTIIAVSHDLNLTGHYGRRGLLLDNGSIVMDDTISNILSEKNIYENFGVNSKVNLNKLTGEISVTIIPH
ncbi:MAG: ABC transporter ATP-binding protein [Ignavibacteriae bacterium]|nr:ABC transporter ATP-binding protein [Ignavibacteriota bacterium]